MTQQTKAPTTRLPREERERLILDAAAEEFGRQGYGGASLGSIATLAGVSKALVLTYFGSKDELYGACAARAGQNLASRIETVITSELDLTAMAEATLAAIFDGLAARPQDWNVINDRTAPRGTEGAAAARQQRRVIAGQASRGVLALRQLAGMEPDDLEILTAVWMNAVSAVVDWWLRHPDRSAAEMTERCTRVLTTLTQS